jgi:hypothetical protein
MADTALTNASTGINNPHNRSNQIVTVLPDNAFAITKSDSTSYDHPVTVWVGGAGDVVVIPWAQRAEASPTSVTFPALAGSIIPVRVWKIMNATTATSLRGIY